MKPSIQSFLKRVSESTLSLLVLDYDGTIAPYHKFSDEALLVPGVYDRVVALHETGKVRVIFNTGRSCENLLAHVALPFPTEVWGCHGREHRDFHGVTSLHGLNEANLSGLVEGRDRIEGKIHPATLLLRNGCLTVFYHDATAGEKRSIAKRCRDAWAPLLDKYRLRIDDFFAGIELNTIGRDKGDAMEAILSSVDPHAVPVVFLGDAETDEDGFRAMGDRGLAILVRSEDDPSTHAHARLKPFDEVLQFLDQMLEAARNSTIPRSASPGGSKVSVSRS